MNRLHRYLPIYHKGSQVYTQITQAETIEFNRLDGDIEDIQKQYNIDTATWGLVIYEKDLGLPIAPDLGLEIRRSIVKARSLLRPPGSKANLVAVIRSFMEDAEIEEYFEEYRFEVILKTEGVVGEKLGHILGIIEDAKPAHLEYIITTCYLSYPVAYTKFNKWLSEKMTPCGTRDVSKKPYTTTLGRRYEERYLQSLKVYSSEKNIVVSEKNLIEGLGRRYKVESAYSSETYQAKKCRVASSDAYIENVGAAYNNEIIYCAKILKSGRLKVCSETTYI